MAVWQIVGADFFSVTYVQDLSLTAECLSSFQIWRSHQIYLGGEALRWARLSSVLSDFGESHRIGRGAFNGVARGGLQPIATSRQHHRMSLPPNGRFTIRNYLDL